MQPNPEIEIYTTSNGITLTCKDPECNWEMAYEIAYKELKDIASGVDGHKREHINLTESKPYINLYKQPEEDWHECHFCGTFVNNGREYRGQRHWLSDCRPDLVKHEIGKDCTWAYRREMAAEDPNYNFKEADTCYAYEEHSNGEWKHTKFYKDGPM